MGRQLLPPRTLRVWLAGLENHRRRFLKRQSVQTLASKYSKDVDVVLGNWTASSWPVRCLPCLPHSRLKVALFKQKLEDDVWKRHHDR